MQEMKPIKEGKVREIYDNGDSLIMVATDRISCFDVILDNIISKKGTVLTQMSKFWFDMTEDIIPNHMISVDVKDMPEFFQQEKFDGNSMMCRKLQMLPIECIVRGYITGSGWASYKENGTVCGIKLPEGLKESDKLPEPIYTPSTKAEIGDHDENISYEQSIAHLEKYFPGKGEEYATKLKDYTIALYKKCAEYALTRGIIIADTKFEFGLDENGNVRDIDMAVLNRKIDELAAKAMRVLAFGYSEKNMTENQINDDVVIIGLVGIRDDVRPEAKEAIAEVQRAGIQVVMVTGDAEETAVAIAKEAGILKDEKTEVVLTHDELEQLSDEELKKKLPMLRVVSRAKPLDKKRLVTIAQQLDDVCGMTGDGVNDAPALKQADIGFAMGDGTAVAQEAGDVVILNNSLTSIKDCVLNSRTMAKSVGKFLIFQLTVNISTLLMNILAPILGWTEPFSIVQILWINLIMDTLAAMAFGGEPILNRYMNEQPAKRSDDILTGYIKSAIGVSAVFITLGSILILENIGGITTAVMPAGCADKELYEKTFMFAFFIYSIIFNSLNTRSEKFNLFEHIGENKRFVLVMGAIFVMQTVLIQIGGEVFSTTPLTLKALLVSMVLGALIIPVDMVRKAIVKSGK